MTVLYRSVRHGQQAACSSRRRGSRACPIRLHGPGDGPALVQLPSAAGQYVHGGLRAPVERQVGHARSRRLLRLDELHRRHFGQGAPQTKLLLGAKTVKACDERVGPVLWVVEIWHILGPRVSKHI